MDTREVIGTLEFNGRVREVAVIRAASGAFWTARDPFIGDRDYKTRAGAVRFLKRTLSEMGVTWAE